MLEVEKFRTMKELLKQQKELERACSDEDILDEVKDNIYLDLVNVNKIIDEVRKLKLTNQEWLDLILNVVNSRDDNQEYKLQIISGTKNHEKIYTFDNFNQIEVQQVNQESKWNATVIVRSDIDIMKFSGSYENGSIFFNPTAYKDYYRSNLFVTYDTFSGDLYIPSYLINEVDIEKLLVSGSEYGLKEKEVNLLNEIVFAIYKELNKPKKRVLK